MSDTFEPNRRAAERAGDAAEDALDDVRRGLDALRGRTEPPPPPPPADRGDGDVVINVNR